MDHTYIDQLDLVERYLMGSLPAEETAQFEEHFVDCLQCVDRLRTTKALIEGLRLAASNEAPATLGYGRRGFFRYLRQSSPRKSFALAAGVPFLLVLAGLVFVSSRVRHLQAEVDQAKSGAAQSERSYEDERQSFSLAERMQRERENELTAQVTQLRAELEDEQKQQPGKMVDQNGRATRPRINFATLVLKSVRGNEPSRPTNELSLPRTPTDFVISIPLEGESGYKNYRMTISSAQNQLIWTDRGFKPDQYNSLSGEFSSTLFSSGDYVLTLEGISGDGSTSPVGKYSFRVLKPH
jgi:hypothetical protein